MNDDLSSSTIAASGSASVVPDGAAGSGALGIGVTVAQPEWLALCPYAETLVREAVGEVFTAIVLTGPGLGLPPIEVDILLSDNDHLAELNATWRGREGPTNVLSFAQIEAPLEGFSAMSADGPPVLLGDLVLAFEVVRDEATGQGKRFDHHLTHLVVHGALHLLGFDHEDAGDAQAMERLEVDILDRLGIENPYVWAKEQVS